MKKRFFYASMAFATLVGMTACSKDENVAPVENKIVDELTIQIDGSTASRATSSGEGNENAVANVSFFVKVAENSEGNNPKYKRINMSGAQSQTTVKYAVAGSTVYAVANGSLGVSGSSPFENDPYSSITPEGVNSAFPESAAGTISKEYIGSLSSADGEFLMSGRANVVKGKDQERLVIQMERDVAKVSFNLVSAKGATAQSAEKYYRPKKAGLKGIVVRRSAQKVQQFLMDGASQTGYELDNWSPGYKQDYPTETFSNWDVIEAKISSINTTKHDGTSEGSSAESTDYTFAYKWANKSTDSYYTFDPFYVLPNYAKGKKNSTVVILATEVEESANNTDSWTDSSTASGVRYYKARISDNLEAFATHKNKHYTIIATLNGPGQASVDDAVNENTADDMYISVQVQDWGLVMSNQNIQ